MTTPVQNLSFSTLRDANRERIPQFRNGRGGPAHAQPDGSDWCPAQWLQALIGEVGEFARVRVRYEAGELSYEDYVVEAQKELADVQCYLDLLASRALDRVAPHDGADPVSALMRFMADLGEYANWRKKFERGDIDQEQFAQLGHAKLTDATATLGAVRSETGQPPVVAEAHPHGVDLGTAARDKFNEVSRRVGANVFIDNDAVSRR
jgi:NTP pyrophosphatase (non-canonical NTP hydrolase)